MNTLTYSEKLFLLLYKRVFDVRFDIIDDSLDSYDVNAIIEMSERSMNSQFLCYFFLCNYVYLGEFGFTWLGTIPYSGNCNSFIQTLGEKIKEVSNFYKNSDEDAMFLFLLEDEKKAEFMKNLCDSLRKIYALNKYSLALAVGLLFIARSVMPYFGYEDVYNELVRRNKKFNSTEYKKLGKQIWNVFLDLNLIPFIDKVYFR